LTGPLTRLATIFRGKHSARKGVGSRISSGLLPAVAILCLLLLAMLAVAQVTHLHPNDTDADHCQLCIVMHTVVPVAAAAAVIIIVQLGASAPQAEPIVVARQRQIRLFIRPPPVSS
jgi:nucleoside recognition membrane protein YjiH